MKSAVPEGMPGSSSKPLKSKIQSPDASKDQDTDLKWWMKEGEDACQSIANTLQAIRLFQVGRLNQMNLSIRLYGNRGLHQLFSAARGNAMRIVRSQFTAPDRLTDNVISSCVDTVHSTMTKNKPAPFFLTSGGTYREQRKARKLTKVSEAMFYEAECYVKGQDCFRDALIMGDGIMHVYEDTYTNRVCLERVPVFELYIDEVEASHGEPRQMHRVRNVDKDVLVGMFPKSEGIIRQTDKVATDFSGSSPLQVSDTVEVRESWHLPSKPGAKDGLHLISVDKGELFREKYEEEWFPFVKMPWSRPVYGYWGTSAAQQIQGQQIQINKLLWLQSTSIHMMGTFKIAYPIGSNIVPEKINNGIGIQIQYSGNVPPAYMTPQPFHEQIPQMMLTVKQSAFEQLGVSMLAAQSKKPDGLDSGKAIREYNYIQTDRFYSKGIEYENFYCDLAKMMLRCARKIKDRDGDYVVQHFASGGRHLGELSLKDVDIEDDLLSIRCFPVSSLPQEPAAREATVQEYVQAGWLTPQRARRLMAFPDLEADDNLADASEELFIKNFETMMEGTSKDAEADYVAPDPLANLALGKELCLQEYAFAMLWEAPEERIALLREWLQQVDAIQQAAMPPPPAPGMPPGPGGTPQGAPMPPPQSNLLPQGSPTATA